MIKTIFLFDAFIFSSFITGEFNFIDCILGSNLKIELHVEIISTSGMLTLKVFILSEIDKLLTVNSGKGIRDILIFSSKSNSKFNSLFTLLFKELIIFFLSINRGKINKNKITEAVVNNMSLVILLNTILMILNI